MVYQTAIFNNEEKPELPLLNFNDMEYDLILDLVQTHLDKRQGHDTVAFRQIHRKLIYNAKGLRF